MLTLKYNPASMRYDCYENGDYMDTLTCGSRFNLYCDDEDTFVVGRIEHHNTAQHQNWFLTLNSSIKNRSLHSNKILFS